MCLGGNAHCGVAQARRQDGVELLGDFHLRKLVFTFHAGEGKLQDETGSALERSGKR